MKSKINNAKADDDYLLTTEDLKIILKFNQEFANIAMSTIANKNFEIPLVVHRLIRRFLFFQKKHFYIRDNKYRFKQLKLINSKFRKLTDVYFQKKYLVDSLIQLDILIRNINPDQFKMDESMLILWIKFFAFNILFLQFGFIEKILLPLLILIAGSNKKSFKLAINILKIRLQYGYEHSPEKILAELDKLYRYGFSEHNFDSVKKIVNSIIEEEYGLFELALTKKRFKTRSDRYRRNREAEITFYWRWLKGEHSDSNSQIYNLIGFLTNNYENNLDTVTDFWNKLADINQKKLAFLFNKITEK